MTATNDDGDVSDGKCLSIENVSGSIQNTATYHVVRATCAKIKHVTCITRASVINHRSNVLSLIEWKSRGGAKKMTGNTGGTGNAAATTGNSAARAADGMTKPKKPKKVKCRQQHPLDPSATLKEKRKKKIAKFLNPLFLCWL